MKTRSLLIAGNWKMHKTIAEALELAKQIHHGLHDIDCSGLGVVISPPYTALSEVAMSLQGSNVSVAAQDMHWEDSGAFTGAVSAPMLKDAGAEYVIIGHSERRQYFGETDATVNKKTHAALRHHLIPIVCVGENLSEREAGQFATVVINQLTLGLQGLNAEEVAKIVVAYEPVWAIGTGRNATPEQAEEVHIIIRNLLAQQFGTDVANKVKVLYGGSVKPSNSKELLALEHIDGALIGGASLKAEDFLGIINSITAL